MTSLIISKLDYQRLKERAVGAKARRSEIAVQASTLLQAVKRATLVESHEIPPDVVTMNSIVRIIYLTTNKPMEIRVVYPEQADSMQGRVSIFSPIASALLGSRKGDIIPLKLSHETVQVKVDSLLYQPEAEGHFFL